MSTIAEDTRPRSLTGGEYRFRGMNPEFVRRVWARRREAEDRALRLRRAPAATERKPDPPPIQTPAQKRSHREPARKALSPAELAAIVEQIEIPEGWITAEGLLALYCDQVGVRASDIRGRSRERWLIALRHGAIRFVARHKPDWSMPRLGMFFEREHTTILYALGRVKNTSKRAGEA